MYTILFGEDEIFEMVFKQEESLSNVISDNEE